MKLIKLHEYVQLQGKAYHNAMYKVPYMVFGLMLLSAFLSACTEKENEIHAATAPGIDSIVLSPDNKLLKVYFTEGVYKANSNFNDALGAEQLSITLTGGQAILDSTQIMHIAGDSVALVRLFISHVINGQETLLVKPFNGSCITNTAGINMASTEQKAIPLHETGIQGYWLSDGENLSPLFQQFNFDSVVMQFNANGTYTQYSSTISGIENHLTGTYTQMKSNVEGIWTITLNQLTPIYSKVEGIFAFKNGQPVMMTYETAQIEPAISGLTPPTPEAGFGSTGIFGSENTQVYLFIPIY